MISFTSFGERACSACRFLLLAGIAGFAALILTAPAQQRSSMNPVSIQSAQAGGGIAAAPNYLALTSVGGSDKIYLIDTTRKVVCIYRIETSALRLTAARKFDNDERIFDASIKMATTGKSVEGGDGATRDEAGKYADELQALVQQGKKKP